MNQPETSAFIRSILTLGREAEKKGESGFQAHAKLQVTLMDAAYTYAEKDDTAGDILRRREKVGHLFTAFCQSSEPLTDSIVLAFDLLMKP